MNLKRLLFLLIITTGFLGRAQEDIETVKKDFTPHNNPFVFKTDSVVDSFNFEGKCDSVKVLVFKDSSNIPYQSKLFVGNIYYPTPKEIYNGQCFCESCTKREFVFKPQNNLTYQISYSGCIDSFAVNVTTKQDLLPKKWFQKRYQAGDVIELDKIHFYPGRSIFLRTSFDELLGLVDLLNEDSTLQIQIQGHVNGPFSKNSKEYQELSENRAKAVYQFLIKKGINPKRLSHAGFGNTKMVFPEPNSEEEMQMNRRVSVFIK